MGGQLPGSPQAVHDRVLVLLSIAITLIFLLALCSFAYTLLLRRRNRLKAENWARLESRWQHQLLELLAETGSTQALWQMVGKGQELYFVDFLLRYARQLRGRELELINELARPYLDGVAGRIHDREAERRARAMYTLGVLALRQPATIKIFAPCAIEGLDDPSPLVAMVALRALARPECQSYAPAVLLRLPRFHMMNRQFLVSVLVGMGGEASGALRGLLGNPRSPFWDRSLAADALGQLHDLEAADIAIGLLAVETDRELLAALLRLLAEVGRPEHLPEVRRMCASDDFVVRANAAMVLGRLGGSEELPLLRQLVEDESNWVAHRAASALRQAGGSGLLGELAASNHPRAELAHQALAEELP